MVVVVFPTPHFGNQQRCLCPREDLRTVIPDNDERCSEDLPAHAKKDKAGELSTTLICLPLSSKSSSLT